MSLPGQLAQPGPAHSAYDGLDRLREGNEFVTHVRHDLARGCGADGDEVAQWGVVLLGVALPDGTVRPSALRSTTSISPAGSCTSRRIVELPRVTAEALQRHLRIHPPAEVQVTGETDPRKTRVRPARLVFTNTAGRPINRGGWSHVRAPAARTLDLPQSPGFHALRHYFATLLISAGASVKTVQMALGHSSPMITLNSYVGMWPDQVDRTRTLVDDALLITPLPDATT